MNKKIISRELFLLNLCLITASRSDDDEEKMPAKPVLQLQELGSGHDSANAKAVYIGSTLTSKEYHHEAE